MTTPLIFEKDFRAASAEWLESRKLHLTPRTYIDYGYYIDRLNLFFGDRRLHEITGDMVRAYQKERREKAGPSVINKELGVLKMMRERIGLPLNDYQRLPLPKDYESPGRALTEKEDQILEQVCRIVSEHPQWKVAALASLLSVKTGMGPGEMLSLKLKDISFDPPMISVPRRGAKRVSRERQISLCEQARWALEQLARRAVEECGATNGENFLFPFQNRDKTYDPTKPAQGYRAGMKHVFDLCGFKCRRYDFRHTAVSKALGNPDVPIQAAVAYFGWINPKMIGRYYHGAQKESQIVAAALGARKAVESEKWKLPKRLKN